MVNTCIHRSIRETPCSHALNAAAFPKMLDLAHCDIVAHKSHSKSKS